MNIKNTLTQYGLVARILHWISVTLLLTIVVIASQFENMLAGPERWRLIALHSSVGLVFFVIMLARSTWRKVNHNPIKSYSIKNWQKTAAISLHRSIYIVLITQCLVGIASLITGQETMQVFSLLEIKPLIDKNTIINHFVLNIHYFISIMIYPLFAIHITAAIYHQIFGLLDE